MMWGPLLKEKGPLQLLSPTTWLPPAPEFLEAADIKLGGWCSPARCAVGLDKNNSL